MKLAATVAMLLHQSERMTFSSLFDIGPYFYKIFFIRYSHNIATL